VGRLLQVLSEEETFWVLV